MRKLFPQFLGSKKRGGNSYEILRAGLLLRNTVGFFSGRARAVERRSTRLVFISYSLRSFKRDLPCTVFRRASNAVFANAICDIRTVVSGGVVNSAMRTSSKPATDSLFGILMA